MPQSNAWEREYQKPKLLTKGNKPQGDIVRAIKDLKALGFSVLGSTVLDIGSGAGRNSIYFQSLGAIATGLEISPTAIRTAEEYAEEAGFSPTFIKHDIGTPFPFRDGSFDLALDIVASNSLKEDERETYLSETFRVLKSGGFFLVKALAKDGDANAKNLLKISPGKEKDTYLMKELGLTERVFTKDDFLDLYGRFFTLKSIIKKAGYPRMNDRVYKRNYFIALFQKS